MNDLALKEKAHANDGMDFLTFISDFKTASQEAIGNNQVLNNLAVLLSDDKLKVLDCDIDVDGVNQPTANSIVAVLCNQYYQPSNLAILPLDNREPFLLHDFNNDGFIFGNGGQVVAIRDLNIAMIIATYTQTRGEPYTVIAPLNKGQFDSVVKSHASQRQVMILTDYEHGLECERTFKGDNVKLAKVVDILEDLIVTHSINDILALNDTKVTELNGIEWGNPRPINQTLPPVKSITSDMLPKPLYDYVLDHANRLGVPLEFIAIPLLVALGSVIGTKTSILPKKFDEWEITANLWGGIAGNPSSKKSPSQSAGLKPIDNLVFKAKQAYENATKEHNAQTLVDAEREKANKERLKELVKKQSKQKEDSKDKVTDEHIQALADSIANPNENAPKPALRRYVTDDSTHEKLGDLESQNPNGILIKRDELTGLLSQLDKDDNQQARAFYLEGYNGTGSYTFDRMMRGTVFIESHCLSIIGGIQPDKLEYYLSQVIKGLNNDGLMQRFSLLVYPDPLPNCKERDLPVNKEIRDTVYRIFETLDSMTIGHLIKYGANEPSEFIKRPYFRLSDDAYPIFMNWYDELKAKANMAEHSIIAEHLMKYPKTLASLALIFHLVDCVESNAPLGAVSERALRASIKWIEMLETHMIRIYSTVTDNAQIKASLLAVKLLDMVKKSKDKNTSDWLEKGFTARQVTRKCWKGLTDGQDVQTAIDVLIEHDWLRWESIATTGQGGRPTEHYYIDPTIRKFIK